MQKKFLDQIIEKKNQEKKNLKQQYYDLGDIYSDIEEQEDHQVITDKIKEYNKEFNQIIEEEQREEVQESKIDVYKEQKERFAQLYKNKKKQEQKDLFYVENQQEEQSQINKKKLIREENKKLIGQEKEVVLEEEEEVELPSDQIIDEEGEFQKWKIRELSRILRDKKERQDQEEQQLETERRRNMSDFQREQEDKRINKYREKNKSDMKYMQSYHKSLVFFQDKEDEIFKRDFNVPVGMDQFDKSVLPKSMWTRGDQFFKKGRSKYKDLKTEDTLTRDNYYDIDDRLMKKIKKQIINQEKEIIF